ncbi:MAG: hypothetical protein JNK53_03060, partial [Phycisphaerae bacterium]|nr:hypothetical protein [Phycisphaerae bacterium]
MNSVNSAEQSPMNSPHSIAAPPTVPTTRQNTDATAGAASTVAYQPLPIRERLVQVDFLRGVALLGILVVNMSFFFQPFGRAIDPTWLHWADQSDRVVWGVVSAFFSFKFISLFSLLFGFGVAMQLGRVDSSGHRVWPFALRRFGVLALIGLLHGTLVWYGDILFIYACLGLVLTALRRVSAKVVLIIALCIAGAQGLFGLAGPILGEFFASSVGEDPIAAPFIMPGAAHEPTGWDAMVDANFFPADPIWMAGEAAAYRDGPFVTALLYRGVSYAFGVGVSVFSYGWHALLMMLLGMWAYKTEFWRPERAALRRR